MKSQLDEFKAWLQTNNNSKMNLSFSPMQITKAVFQEGWKFETLVQAEILIDINSERAKAKLEPYTHEMFQQDIQSVYSKILQLNGSDFLQTVRSGTVTISSLTPDRVKQSELENVWKLFVLIKNYFLFVTMQIQLLAKMESAETVLNATDKVFKKLYEVKTGLFIAVVDIKMKLKKYSEHYLKELGESFLVEMRFEIHALEKMRTTILFERCIFRQGDATQLQDKYSEFEPAFRTIAAGENPNAFYLWCPCVTPPLTRARQQLSEIKNINVEDEQTAYSVLALFMKVYGELEDDNEFKEKMEQCFQNALSVTIKSVPQEMQTLAKVHLHEYQHPEEAEKSSGIPIRMRKFGQQGYHLLK